MYQLVMSAICLTVDDIWNLLMIDVNLLNFASIR